MKKKLLERLYFRISNNLALYCQQTGLYNKNWWIYIALKKYGEKSVFVTVVDIDNLKKINDSKGHIYGDDTIICVANKLKQHVSGEIIHYGGDEFVIISKTDPTESLTSLYNYSCVPSFSFGVYYKTEECMMIEAFERADKLMYEMKRNKVTARMDKRFNHMGRED